MAREAAGGAGKVASAGDGCQNGASTFSHARRSSGIIGGMVPRARSFVWLVLAAALAAGCGGGGGGPTGTDGENLCGRVSFGNNPARISVASRSGCTATTGGFTNHVFDPFGRVLSFDFDITCTAGGSERLVGRVFNVTYNNVGEILSLQATINGRSCRLPS